MLNQVSVFGNKSLRAIQELGSMAVFAGAMAISALKPPLRRGPSSASFTRSACYH